jgi:hypothetical protein
VTRRFPAAGCRHRSAANCSSGRITANRKRSAKHAQPCVLGPELRGGEWNLLISSNCQFVAGFSELPDRKENRGCGGPIRPE